MRRLIAAGGILMLAGAALAQDRRGGPPSDAGGMGRGVGNSYANPSAIIAAERALSRDARARGEWTALAAAAAPDAVVFAPTLTWAQPWLKGRTEPRSPTDRQAFEVWASCDGSLAVAQGAWTRARATGSFAAVWQRQPDETWKWLVTDLAPLDQPLAVPDMLSAHVADCPERKRSGGGAPLGRPGKVKPVKIKDLPPPDPAARSGVSADQSMTWKIALTPEGRRRLTVTVQHNGADQVVVSRDSPPG